MAVTGDFGLVVSRAGEDIIVFVAGELDILTAPQLRRLAGDLVDMGIGHLVIDLGDTTFLGSTGLGALVGLARRMRERGGEFSIRNARPHVRKVIEITGLVQLFDVHG